MMTQLKSCSPSYHYEPSGLKHRPNCKGSSSYSPKGQHSKRYQFRCWHYRPREEPIMVRGESLAVFSSIASRADDTTFRQMQKLFQEEAGSNWFYSFDMPGQGGSSESAKVSAASLPRQVKLLH